MSINKIEIDVTEETDLREAFNKTYKNVFENYIDEDSTIEMKEAIKHDFISGVGVGRNAFEKLFRSETIFMLSPNLVRQGFIKALQSTQNEAIKNEEYVLAQGISCFALWTAAIALQRRSDKEYMEQVFFRLVEDQVKPH